MEINTKFSKEQKLDAILNLVKTYPVFNLSHTGYKGELQKALMEYKINEDEEYKFILSVLFEDGFVKGSSEVISLTHKGFYADEKEYEKQKTDKEAATLQEKSNTDKLMSYSKRLAVGTKYLWIATSFLVLMELLKLYIEYHCK